MGLFGGNKDAGNEVTLGYKGDDIVMTRASDVNIERDYEVLDLPRHIQCGHKELATQDALSRVFAAALQAGAAGAAAGNGLFTATVPMNILTKFANGTYSTMVHGSGEILGHRGFVPVTGAMFAPLVIFQALAMATGQYYMHGIATQLNEINAKLDELIKANINEMLGKLDAAKDLMQELSKAEHITAIDEAEFANARVGVRGILNECKHHLEGIDINKITAVNSWWTAKHRLSPMKKGFEASRFVTYYSIAAYADNLLHGMRILEMSLCMRSGKEEYNKKAGEMWQEINSWKNEDFFVRQVLEMPAGKIYERMAEAAKKVLLDPKYSKLLVLQGIPKYVIDKCEKEQQKLDSAEYTGFPSLEIAVKADGEGSKLYAKKKSLSILPAVPELSNIFE